MPLLASKFDEGYDRLQALLLEMRVGDVLYVREAAEATGLPESACRTALEALRRVGLMSREPDDRFVRLTLDALRSSVSSSAHPKQVQVQVAKVGPFQG